MKTRKNNKIWRLAKFLWEEIGYVSSNHDHWIEVSMKAKEWWYDKAKKIYFMMGYNE